jgi:hypothetical protein
MEQYKYYGYQAPADAPPPPYQHQQYDTAGYVNKRYPTPYSTYERDTGDVSGYRNTQGSGGPVRNGGNNGNRGSSGRGGGGFNNHRSADVVTMDRFEIWCNRLTSSLDPKNHNLAHFNYARDVVTHAAKYNKSLVRRFSSPFMFETVMRMTNDYIAETSAQNLPDNLRPEDLLRDALMWSEETCESIEKHQHHSHARGKEKEVREPRPDSSIQEDVPTD